jgi:putative polyketide hydroxylase
MLYEETPVLIVGGGIVGLSASLFLLHHGIPSILVERHSGTSIHPRARGINGRTAEIYRELGLDEKIREAGAALAPALGWLYGESLMTAENWTVERWEQMSKANVMFGGPGMDELSPVTGARCTQDLLEPLLLDAARQRGGDLRFYTELVSFEQDDMDDRGGADPRPRGGVIALIRDRTSGIERTVRAQYMIAADGARAHIREQLGIATSGQGSQGHLLNILFEADLSDLVRGREFSACIVERPELHGLIIAINNTNRWAFHVVYDPQKGEKPEDFPPERCIELIRIALGLPEIAIRILSILPWEVAVRVANSFQQGRVFLAGDAAHQMPPWGGMGANSGVADVHNLAWKLAAVLKGHATSALLSTYDVERRPVGYAAAVGAGNISGKDGLPTTEMFVFQAGKPGFQGNFMDILIKMSGLGYQYASQAIIAEGEPSDSVMLDGRPGTRTPHTWVEYQGKRISTLDLFGLNFVLLTGPEGASWCEAARAIATCSGLNLVAYRIDPDGDLSDLESKWQVKAGIQADGALLVRPDGFVAWRSQIGALQPEQVLEQVLKQVIGYVSSTVTL